MNSSGYSRLSAFIERISFCSIFEKKYLQTIEFQNDKCRPLLHLNFDLNLFNTTSKHEF